MRALPLAAMLMMASMFLPVQAQPATHGTLQTLQATAKEASAVEPAACVRRRVCGPRGCVWRTVCGRRRW